MKVLLFSDSDVFAGTERHIADLAEALLATAARPALACPTPSPLADKASAVGVEVIPIAKRRLPDLPAVLTLRRLLRSGEVDLIHAHNGRTTLIAAMAKELAGRGRLVATQHFLQPSRVGRRGLKAAASNALHRWVARRVDHVLAISHAVCDAALARHDVEPDSVTVVHNGIAAVDRVRLRGHGAVRSELGLAIDAPLIVCAARLEVEKDVVTLIEAMVAVRSSHPAAVCVVAGGGSLEAELQEKVRHLGLDGAVRLLGFRPDVLSLIDAGDLFVLPSLAEAFGLVLLEAMSLSKPVIATRAGGPLEIVDDGSTGLLVPPKDPRSLGAAIARLLSDPAGRRRMGELGRRRFLERFTADRMAAATAAVYRKVLGLGDAQAPAPAATVAGTS